MKILVTGGAGYIGSFMVKRLLEDNEEVTVVDSLEKGYEVALDKRAIFKKGNLSDQNFLNDLFSSSSFDAVIHFAAYISVGESMSNPFMYFENNSFTTLKLIEEAVKQNIKKIIFSSTAAVYGNPVKIPIPENHPKNPENPYGESKLMIEKMLKWYQEVYGLSFVVLRYFNACGAALDGSIGENHSPETHIIPCAVNAVLNEKPFTLFGSDYNTPDGTCVRDYIHVLDLVESHILALGKLNKESGAFYYNVGTGKGYSNKEIIEMVKKVSGNDFQVILADRRAGDPDTLVADPSKINAELQFSPKYSDLETIIKSAYEWAQKKNEK